jgi:hypothetical protein
MRMIRRVITRALLLILAAATLVWSWNVFPALRAGQGASVVASDLIAGRAYRPEVMSALEAWMAENERYLRPSHLSKVAVFRLRQTEQALAGADLAVRASSLARLKNAIQVSLANAPSDAFLWLALLWVDRVEGSRTPEDLAYLRMSYHLGAREGWIATKRSQLALANYSSLPSDLADSALKEFAGLLESRIFPEAAGIFLQAEPGVRDRLLDRMKELDGKDRKVVAKMLADQGFENVQMLYQEAVPSRPWR